MFNKKKPNVELIRKLKIQISEKWYKIIRRWFISRRMVPGSGKNSKKWKNFRN